LAAGLPLEEHIRSASKLQVGRGGGGGWHWWLACRHSSGAAAGPAASWVGPAAASQRLLHTAPGLPAAQAKKLAPLQLPKPAPNMPDGSFNPALSLRQAAGYTAVREAGAMDARVSKAQVLMQHGSMFSSTLPAAQRR
jgi:hypothetical protein